MGYIAIAAAVIALIAVAGWIFSMKNEEAKRKKEVEEELKRQREAEEERKKERENSFWHRNKAKLKNFFSQIITEEE